MDFSKRIIPANGETYFLMYTMQPLTERFAADLQETLERKYRDIWQKRPGLSLDEIRVILLYHGMDDQPDGTDFVLPNGKAVKVVNVGQGHNPSVRASMHGIPELMEVGRDALLRGASPRKAAQKAYAYAVIGKIGNRNWCVPDYGTLIQKLTELQDALQREGLLHEMKEVSKNDAEQ